MAIMRTLAPPPLDGRRACEGMTLASESEID